MKRLFNIIVCAYLLVLSNAAFADCYTGFACSIEDLSKQNQLQTNEFINNINSYFEKKISEDIFFGKKVANVNYNDLFIFNTIV